MMSDNKHKNLREKKLPIFRHFSWIAFFTLLSFILVSCSKDDSYYDRPAWLEKPIYDVLKEQGNFTMYLQAVDKTLYSRVLKGAGFYTVFAPNDEAFSKFLSENNYSSIDNVPVSELTKIVGYSMVFNKFTSSHLGDVLTSGQWTSGQSIKKKTSYYLPIYKEMVNGKEVWVIDATSDIGDINTPYKYLPIFTSTYFTANGLTAEDYNAFYPNSTFTGYNVISAAIVNKDWETENGIIHEVNTVLYPLKNLDEKLKEPQNKSFYDILNISVGGSNLFAIYTDAPNTAEVYKKLYPDSSIVSVYYKNYPSLPFSPNMEEYKGSSTLTSEAEGYTMLIPSNAAVDNFATTLKTRAKVDDLSQLSMEVLGYFLKGHMADGLIWPSNFKSAQNSNGEFINGMGNRGTGFAESGITGSSFCSNGIMYNIDHVIPSKYFNTVYSEILLNPSYKLLYYAFNKYYKTSLQEDLMKSPITGYLQENYTILLPSDDLLKADGYKYDQVNNTFTNSVILGTTNSDDRLKRLMRMCVFERTKNEDTNTTITDFQGNPELGYDGFGYAVNDYGDMIRFKNNKLQAVGNILSNEWVTATELTSFPYNNGKVFTLDKLLQYSPRTTNPTAADGWNDQTLYTFITKYVAQNSNASKFLSYLNATLYNPADGTIAGISTSGYYTILIPQNDMIDKAVADGYLPPLSQVLPANDKIFAKAANFINSCFLSGTVIADDGKSKIEPGNYDKLNVSTIYRVNDPDKDLISVKTYIEASKVNGALVFTPKNIEEGVVVKVKGINQAKIIRGITKSNYMGPRAVIHAVDNYLTFQIQ